MTTKRVMAGCAPLACSQLVPVTMSELYGPVECKKCTCQAWTIWVTPEVKRNFTFPEIYKHHGEARCDQCGPPDSANADVDASPPLTPQDHDKR